MNEGLGESFEHVRELNFWGEVPHYWVLQAYWRPGQAGGLHPEVYGIAVSVYPIRSVDRAEVRRELCETALPALRDWIAHAVAASETWKAVQHARSWRWTEDGVLESQES
ncbi:MULTISPECIES: hypothetical protein [Streptosporangium]|uniref:Uncharacterized protein n=1 Tax=Streptosporangium brasiliense TaxID=47480 RepID=A0ABT9R222_9ACTN|nr:hypothetical protein [Streptosporangium brasiliense]MDP9863281.1 hypothetical protein [Streptosporangium brasiliense]